MLNSLSFSGGGGDFFSQTTQPSLFDGPQPIPEWFLEDEPTTHSGTPSSSLGHSYSSTSDSSLSSSPSYSLASSSSSLASSSSSLASSSSSLASSSSSLASSSSSFASSSSSLSLSSSLASSSSSSSTSSLPSHSFTTTKPSLNHGAQKENVNFTPNGHVTQQDRVSVEPLPNHLRPRQQLELNSNYIRQKHLPKGVTPKIRVCQLPNQPTKRFKYDKDGRFNVKGDMKGEWVDLGVYKPSDPKRFANARFKIVWEGWEEGEGGKIVPCLKQVFKKENRSNPGWIEFDFLEEEGCYVVPEWVQNNNAFSLFFVFACEIEGQRIIVLPSRIIIEEEIISKKPKEKKKEKTQQPVEETQTTLSNQVTLDVSYLKFGRYGTTSMKTPPQQKESPLLQTSHSSSLPSFSSFTPSSNFKATSGGRKRRRTNEQNHSSSPPLTPIPTPPLPNGGREPSSSRVYFPASQVSSPPSPAPQVHFPFPLQYPSSVPFGTPSRNPFFKMVEQGSYEDHWNLSTDFQKLFEEQKRDAVFMGSRPKDYRESTIERGKKYEELLQRQTQESREVVNRDNRDSEDQGGDKGRGGEGDDESRNNQKRNNHNGGGGNDGSQHLSTNRMDVVHNNGCRNDAVGSFDSNLQFRRQQFMEIHLLRLELEVLKKNRASLSFPLSSNTRQCIVVKSQIAVLKDRRSQEELAGEIRSLHREIETFKDAIVTNLQDQIVVLKNKRLASLNDRINELQETIEMTTGKFILEQLGKDSKLKTEIFESEKELEEGDKRNEIEVLSGGFCDEGVFDEENRINQNGNDEQNGGDWSEEVEEVRKTLSSSEEEEVEDVFKGEEEEEEEGFCCNPTVTRDSILAPDPQKLREVEESFLTACLEGNESSLEVLLEEIPPALLSHKFEGGRTCFHVACSMGKKDIVMLLLKKAPYLQNLGDESNRTGFVLACQAGHYHIVDLLLNSHPPIKSQKEGFFVSCFEGHKKLVHMLLKRNSSLLYKKNSIGQTGFDIAVEQGHENLMKLFFKQFNRVKKRFFQKKQNQFDSIDVCCEGLSVDGEEGRKGANGNGGRVGGKKNNKRRMKNKRSKKRTRRRKEREWRGGEGGRREEVQEVALGLLRALWEGGAFRNLGVKALPFFSFPESLWTLKGRESSWGTREEVQEVGVM